MIRIITLLTMLLFAQVSFAQQNELIQFNKERNRISKTGLKILVGYSAANIIYSSLASANNNETSGKYFHQMNIIWNGITLGLAGIGVLVSKKEGFLTFANSLNKQSGIEQLFLFNAGLDLAYIAGGAYLKERAVNSQHNPLRSKGYGNSIMLQGAVLFLFDGIMYSVHRSHGKLLNKLAEKVQLSAAHGIGLTVIL